MSTSPEPSAFGVGRVRDGRRLAGLRVDDLERLQEVVHPVGGDRQGQRVARNAGRALEVGDTVAVDDDTADRRRCFWVDDGGHRAPAADGAQEGQRGRERKDMTHAPPTLEDPGRSIVVASARLNRPQAHHREVLRARDGGPHAQLVHPGPAAVAHGQVTAKWLPLTCTGMGVWNPGGQYIWYGAGTGYDRRRLSSATRIGPGASTRASPTPAKVAGAAIVPVDVQRVAHVHLRRASRRTSRTASTNSCAKQGTGISVGRRHRLRDADADLLVPRLEDVLAVPVVRRLLVEEHVLRLLDVPRIDARLRGRGSGAARR